MYRMGDPFPLVVRDYLVRGAPYRDDEPFIQAQSFGEREARFTVIREDNINQFVIADNSIDHLVFLDAKLMSNPNFDLMN